MKRDLLLDVEHKAYVLFDGDCGICTKSAEYCERLDGGRRFVVTPYQSIAESELRRLGTDYDACSKRLHVITRARTVRRGAFAVNHFLWHVWPWKVLVALIYALPPILLLEIVGYAIVARYRHRISAWFGLTACNVKLPTTD
ncbi:MAG: DUF393 domain-containing protein [Myxococcales bacterium]|nr:DUF393 domain-containing protein [Myxococcales bacterium]